ncbi:acyltransferase [Galactobacter sp.]|uniref:acyltransferase family protein n=1 Tax=Galactobacter sp. TaxID=2676125 RepID=UPI0025C0E4E4|nr:acyltransferase [Galactobacter sp.]
MPLVTPLYPYRRPTPVPPATVGATPAKPSRDAGIDALRAGCLLIVVVLHSLMVGVTRSDDGGLVTSVALNGSWGFTVASWFFQVMPLFFMAGGFASLTQWRRLEASGTTASEYVLGRVRRLALPTAVMVTFIGAGLLTARICGASSDLLASAGLHAVQPLWFLAVYVGCTALVPVMERLHRRHGVSVLAWLGAGVVIVDLLARVTSPAVGFLNLALVWPLMQQLGFLVHDGALQAWSRRRLIGAAAGSLGLLGTLMALGYSPNMLVNLNPPTLALVFLGLAQFFLLVAVRPRMNAALDSPRARKITSALSGWSMGVYLWHLPVALVLVAVLGGLNAGLPRPESLSWWFTRIPWMVAVFGCTAAAAAAARRIQGLLLSVGAARSAVQSVRGRRPGMNRPVLTATLSASAAIVGTATVLLLGAASWVGVGVGVALIWFSVLLSHQRRATQGSRLTSGAGQV